MHAWDACMGRMHGTHAWDACMGCNGMQWDAMGCNGMQCTTHCLIVHAHSHELEDTSKNYATLMLGDKSRRDGVVEAITNKRSALSNYKTEVAMRVDLGVTGLMSFKDAMGDVAKLKAIGLCMAFGSWLQRKT